MSNAPKLSETIRKLVAGLAEENPEVGFLLVAAIKGSDGTCLLSATNMSPPDFETITRQVVAGNGQFIKPEANIH